MAGKKGQKINAENSHRNPQYWKKLNPTWSDEECERKADWIRKSSNYRCIEYYERYYPELSHEEHILLRKQKLKEQKTNYPNCIDYYEKRFPELSHEDHLKMLNEYSKAENYQCIEYYEKRFPELSHEEHLKMRQEKIKAALEKMPDIFGENNPNSKSNTTLEQRQERSPFSKKFYEKRNLTEDARKKFTDSIDREYNTQLSYYINKGYDNETALEKLKERQRTFTKEKCIQKYGEIEGIKRFNERQEKWKHKLQEHFYKNGDGRSPQSTIAKEIISAICEYFNVEIPKTEKYLYNKRKQCAYAYDFCFKHKILEINGDYWHCNPKIYNETYINKTKGLSAKEIWEADYEKIQCAESYGYKTLVIWEFDYKENKDREIQKCIEFFE